MKFSTGMNSTEAVEESDAFSDLPDHTLENILTRVSLASVGATRCVSKRWRALTFSSTFLAAYSERQEQSESWIYVNGFRYRITDIPLPCGESLCSFSTSSAAKLAGHAWGAGGIAYALPDLSKPLQNVRYKLSALHPDWQETPALTQHRILPIVGAVKNLRNGAHKIVCAGGSRTVAGKLEPVSKVELFDSEANAWEECEDVPGEFQGLACSRSVTAVVCQRQLYLFHIYSGSVTSFDVVTKRWSKVVTLRPPDTEYCYLAVQNCEPLLVGVSNENNRFLFRGWKVDRSTMACTGDSWPVVCHFASVQSFVDVNKTTPEASPARTTMAVSAVSLQPIFRQRIIASCLKHFSRIAEVIDNLHLLWKAIA